MVDKCHRFRCRTEHLLHKVKQSVRALLSLRVFRVKFFVAGRGLGGYSRVVQTHLRPHGCPALSPCPYLNHIWQSTATGVGRELGVVYANT